MYEKLGIVKSDFPHSSDDMKNMVGDSPFMGMDSYL